MPEMPEHGVHCAPAGLDARRLVPEPHPSGPPPLDRVAAEPSLLDLDLTGESWFSGFSRDNLWLLTAVAATVVALIVCLLGWRWMHPARRNRLDGPACGDGERTGE